MFCVRILSWSTVFIGMWVLAGVPQTKAANFAIRQETDRLVIVDGGQTVATYVFRDPDILRPYFAHVHAPSGIQVTRNHPPVAGVDDTDHETMHPGIWLAFGDINGQDFWRNKASIVHVRFLESPAVDGDRLTFATASVLRARDDEVIGDLVSRFTLSARPAGYLLVWDAVFEAKQGELVFGDQEEMGLGVRVATTLTEKNGGRIVNSGGAEGAEATWGRVAAWSDYASVIDQHRVGILLMPDPGNFRPSWFHNRDYGLMAANPFGRKAFTQGEPSSVVVSRGEQLQLRFGLLMHAVPRDQRVDLEAEYEYFTSALTP